MLCVIILLAIGLITYSAFFIIVLAYYPTTGKALQNNANNGFKNAEKTNLMRENGRKILGKMVGRAGLEPATNWLKANCSTN